MPTAENTNEPVPAVAAHAVALCYRASFCFRPVDFIPLPAESTQRGKRAALGATSASSDFLRQAEHR